MLECFYCVKKIYMEQAKRNRFQIISQVILPFIGILIILVICGFLLFIGVQDGFLNYRILSDISIAFLVFFIIPSGILFLALLITSIYLMLQLHNWFFNKLINVQSIPLRINPSIQNICKKSVQPFIFIESIISIFKQNKSKG